MSSNLSTAVKPFSRFTDFDIDLFKAGKHYKLYEKFGSHVMELEGVAGTYFSVWAPNGIYVSVIGNFNVWDSNSHPLSVRWDSSGIWEGFIPHLGRGEAYKYYIRSASGETFEKGDPFALYWEEPPRTASIVWDTFFEWKDAEWVQNRHQINALNKPISVYEIHFGSWKRDPGNPERFLSYREIADDLCTYVKEMGFTHVEFMPIMEHPFSGSWGYQVTGYFAATSRFGPPQDLMFLIEKLHNEGIGVILDWVPSHFPGDAHGLYYFDGSHLYEHADPRLGYHPDWSSYIFNYGRNEVRSFLLSNALFWLDRYHADGLRVDAVASMLYLDYSRKHDEWIPNEFGGRENLDAISLLKELNETVYKEFPSVQTIAEESTAFPGVSKPTYSGGLGFGMKWMMGWMNDSLNYFSKDPVYRKYHQDQITFSTVYGFSENFMLPLSHDEVVYGKGALVNKMPGDEWQRFANLRLLYGYMFTHPGTKLLFMGGEFGQTSEWSHDRSLDWHLTQFPPHWGVQEEIKALNHLYRTEPALYEKEFSSDGFEWIDRSDAENAILVYQRKGHNWENDLVIVLNMTPMVRYNYRIGVSHPGIWMEIFNSDNLNYYGSGVLNEGERPAQAKPWQGKNQSIEISLPPLSVVVIKLKEVYKESNSVEKKKVVRKK